MKRSPVLLALMALMSPLAAQPDGVAQFQREHYDEALPLLVEAYRTRPDPATQRYLALTYYQLGQYAEARSLLVQALTAQPDDAELRTALVDVLLGLGEAQAALPEAERLAATTAGPAAALRLGRSQAALGQTDAAISTLERALEPSEPRLYQSITRELAPLYVQQGEPERARRLLEQAIALNPDSFDAPELRVLTGRLTGSGDEPRFTFNAGYRLEYDSNVALAPDAEALPGLADESDLRNAYFADLLLSQPLGNGFALYGEGHLNGGLHQDQDEFDFLEQQYSASLGWDQPRYGLRLPLEYGHVSVDGETLLESVTLAPGAYVRPSINTLLYGFVRLTDNDFDEAVSPSEDRSGDVTTYGLSLRWRYHPLGEVRAILESGDNDTDGRNWERDENRFYLYGTYRPVDALELGLGYEYRHDDYANVHDVFLIERDDRVRSVFASAVYTVAQHWDIQFQAVHSDNDSNIPAYAYDRDVFSLGFTWRY